MDTPPALWTKDDVADYLAVSVTTVERLMVRDVNPLPHSRVGGQVRFQSGDVVAWVATNQAHGEAK